MQKTKLIRNAPHQKYFLADGTQVSGGSTICKIGEDAGGLIHWAWDLGKQGKDYRKERDNAADIGTIAHFLIECYLNGQVADLDDYSTSDIEKALVCYNKFHDWWEDAKLKKVATEIQLVNEHYRYGGTIDLIATNEKGEHILIDFKTSKKISESYWRQCAGYAALWDFNQPIKDCFKSAVNDVNGFNHSRDWKENIITSHAIVRIGKQDEGDFEVVWKEDLSNYWHTFKQQVLVWWALKEEKPKKEKKAKK
jgi:hypothetical protein